ncbi:hypothetical protein GQ53DRAFT_203284 [Thozetella sp. PMI_491]|nr:hypothetical protein GQ53DRAFT_203284 [Thozetella sp. PMI_491]
MDHLPQHDTDHIFVPFVAEPRVYRPDDFFSLPQSINCSVTQLLQSGPSLLPLEEAPAFFQSWLCFALLAQVLNEEVHSERFLWHRHSRKELNTEDIISLFEGSPRPVQQSPGRSTLISENAEKYHRVRASLALDEARVFVLTWCTDRDRSATSYDAERSDEFRHRNPELCLSFGILGETLDRFRTRHRPWRFGKAKGEAQHYGSWQDHVSDQRSWGLSNLLCRRMVETGWCPKEVRRISVTAGDLSSMYYISSFKPSRELDHSGCDVDQCLLDFNIVADPHTPQCLFRDNTSGCIVPDEDKLNMIVAEGHIPIIRFDNKEELTMTQYVLGQTREALLNLESPRFVAISHAWSDGLGPSDGIGLPRCQLIRIRDTLKKHPETKDLPFWIDSLCVPRRVDLKNKAIQMMGQVYSHAYTVLVLDSTLRTTSSFPETFEAIIRINTGIWATRMWTLPEGVRARNLHFDFKDGLLSTDDLRRRYSKAKQNPLDREHHVYKAGWLFSPYIFSMRSKIEKLQTLGKRNGAARHEQVAHIWQSMQWREAGRPEDEVLCLARLLDIDPLPLLRMEADHGGDIGQRRMVEFLDLLDQYTGIPPGMIFLPGPKLPVKGFAWAPVSWMCKRSRDLASPLFVSDQRLSFLTRNGLHVQYRGIRLHPGRKALESQFWIPTTRNLTKWFRVEFIPESDNDSWAEIWERACEGDELPGIIRSRFDRHEEPELALLVKGTCRRNEELNNGTNGNSTHAREDVWWTKSLCRVWIQWETNHAVAARLTEDFRYNIDEMTWGESLDADQRWVVDGPIE